MGYSGIYVARFDAISISTARTMVQVNAPATAILEIIRMWVSFSATTSLATEIGVKRVTTAGTNTSFTPIKLHPADATSGATAGVNATAEGTIGDVIWREFVNQQSGWVYLPVPEERIVVGPSGRIALYLPTAPAAVTVSAGIIWGELG